MKKINLKILITGGVITILFILYMLFFYETPEIQNNNVSNEIIQEQIIEEKEENENIKTVYVEIKGAINNPGVYELDSNSRIIDVVNMAGGFRDDANTRYINLSKKVKDEMDIIIYTNEEINNAKESKVVVIEKECVCPVITNDACIEEDNKTTDTKENNSTLISINTSSLEELLTIPGIGESKAKSIIEYRKDKKFETIEDIKNVSGIGESLFEKIKEYITV